MPSAHVAQRPSLQNSVLLHASQVSCAVLGWKPSRQTSQALLLKILLLGHVSHSVRSELGVVFEPQVVHTPPVPAAPEPHGTHDSCVSEGSWPSLQSEHEVWSTEEI